MKSHLTLHIVIELPWSNLNRDDSGLPKRLRQGGVTRGMLSSQAIKRGARTDYEASTGDITYRSANLAELVADRAIALAPTGDRAAYLKEAKKRIGALTKATEAAAGEKDSGRSAWLSSEEIEAAALAIVESKDEKHEFIAEGQSGALAIAAFGRMFAAKPSLQTEAAVAVSPAVSTHATVIESDYFSTVEDHPSPEQGMGATYLGVSHYLNGVFYRSVTIDREQLRRSWTGFGQPETAEKLAAMVTALIYGMPRGKENATAPYTAPALVLVESQSYRISYDFETPVQATDGGGYLAATIDRLRRERDAAHQFDPDNFGDPQAVAGTSADLESFGLPITNRRGIADLVAQWILQ